MSKGSTIIPVRFPDDLLKELQEAVESRNQHTREAPDTVSSWIRRCVQEKLAHRKRSNPGKSKKAKEATPVEDLLT